MFANTYINNKQYIRTTHLIKKNINESDLNFEFSQVSEENSTCQFKVSKLSLQI